MNDKIVNDETNGESENINKPLTKEGCPNMTQLQIDAANVFENRVDIATFTTEYQQKIRNFYRFSPVSTSSAGANAAKPGRSFWK